MRLATLRIGMITIAAPLLLLLGCASDGVTAVNPLTGEQRPFESESEVPEGWIVCASPETCPAPRPCEELDEGACLSRTDCTATYVGIGAYPRECEGPNPPDICDGEAFAGCVDAAPTCDPTACGPAPGAPAFICPDGSVGGNTGRCVMDASGSCSWEFRDCPTPRPEECSPTECGPAPGVPSYECPDGSIGGSTGRCLRLSEGGCGWEIRECPDPTAACTDAECGPAPASPAYECPDGSWGGNIGVCERDDTGTCGWVIRECPDPTPRECTVDECGPAPGAPNFECWDGSIGGPVCELSAAGTCGWIFRECPPEPTPTCPTDCGTYCTMASECTLPADCMNPGCGCPIPTCS